jgi:putative peptidoglycan lipid II flippase
VLILPVSLSLGLINLNGVVDVQFASYLGQGGVAAMNYAFRLYQLPEALFAIAVGTVLFPTLSKLAARNDSEQFRSTVSRGLRVIFFLLIPITALILVLSEPIVRLVYERGEFSAADTSLVAYTLFFFAFGSAFSGGSALLTRGFFSLERPWIPTLLALANLGVNALLNWAFIKPFELGGIALSTTSVSILTFLALLFMLRREMGRIDGMAILRTVVQVSLISAAAAAAAWPTWHWLDGMLGESLVAQLASLGTAMIAGAVVFLILAAAIKAPELSYFKSLRSPGSGKE